MYTKVFKSPGDLQRVRFGPLIVSTATTLTGRADCTSAVSKMLVFAPVPYPSESFLGAA
jgi:hypothetical protein